MLQLAMNMKKEGYLGGSDGKVSACNMGNLGSLDWEDPLDEDMANHSSILCLENLHGQRSLAG